MSDITRFADGEEYDGRADTPETCQYVFKCRRTRHDDDTVDFVHCNSVPRQADEDGSRSFNPEKIPVYERVKVRVENGKETATIKHDGKNFTLHADRKAVRFDRAVKERRVFTPKR